jgi:PAS domain-containing protein
MILSFFKSKRLTDKHKRQDALVIASQQALLSAARETTKMAVEVADALQTRVLDTERQLYATSNLVQEAIVVTDSDLKIKNTNSSACRLFDKNESSIIDTCLSDYFIIDDYDSIKHLIDTSSQVQLKSSDVKIKADYTYSPKSSGDTAYIFLFKDISLENQLEELRVKYDVVTNTSPMAIFLLDSHFSVIETNEEARNIIKYYSVKFDEQILDNDSIVFSGNTYSINSTKIDHLGKTCYVVFMSSCDC